MFNQAASSCPHYFLCTQLHLIKPQSLRVQSAAYMFNQAAYSCTHYFLCTHLHLIKPQSLRVESAAYMFYQAAYSCTHYFFVESSLHYQATVSPGWELSQYVELSCLFLHPLLSMELSSYNQATDNSLFRLRAQLICLMMLLIPAPITFCGVIFT